MKRREKRTEKKMGRSRREHKQTPSTKTNYIKFRLCTLKNSPYKYLLAFFFCAFIYLSTSAMPNPSLIQKTQLF